MTEHNSEDIALIVREIAMKRKREACDATKGITDIPAFVLVGFGKEFVGVDNMREGNPLDNLPSLLNDIAQSGLIYWENLSFITEAFLRTNTDNANITDNYEHGDLEKDYKHNPLSSVKEGLVVTTITWNGDIATKFTPYGYNDKGKPVFEEVYKPTTEEGEEILGVASGRSTSIITSFSEYCHEELNSDEGADYVEAITDLVNEKGLPQAFEHLIEVRRHRGDPNLN